jgi:CheY-like chemotaxis protein
MVSRTWQYRTKPLGIYALILMSGLSFWFVARFIQQTSSFSSVQIVAMKISYLGVSVVPPAWLALMDIMMPYKDGYTACTEIKADLEIGDTPVIMLSALGFKMNKKLATRFGADGFLTKPFTRQELIIAIEPFLLFSKRDVNR